MMSEPCEFSCLPRVLTLSTTVFGNKLSTHKLWGTFKILTKKLKTRQKFVLKCLRWERRFRKASVLNVPFHRRPMLHYWLRPSELLSVGLSFSMNITPQAHPLLSSEYQTRLHQSTALLCAWSISQTAWRCYNPLHMEEGTFRTPNSNPSSMLVPTSPSALAAQKCVHMLVFSKTYLFNNFIHVCHTC